MIIAGEIEWILFCYSEQNAVNAQNLEDFADIAHGWSLSAVLYDRR